MSARRIALLGSTGSIGVSTCEVVRALGGRVEIVALATGANIEALAGQARMFNPRLVAVADESRADELRAMLPGVEVAAGADGLNRVATLDEADMVVSAIVGAAGIVPTIEAIRAGKDVALANKEALVAAGLVVMDLVRAYDVALIPVDSEHSAVLQCLQGADRSRVRRIVLTASGGPFIDVDPAALGGVTVEQALAHPTWSMGEKITIDSATMMNKGLEVIEARWLFDCAPDEVDVVVHPESIVHSLVEFRDGSVLAQLGLPDMHAPIALALTWPERLALALPRLDLSELAALHFEAPDHDRFPCLGLAFAALRGSEAAPAVLNAANEVAVAAFLAGRVPFPGIAATNGAVLDGFLAGSGQEPLRDLADAREADQLGRIRAEEALSSVALANGAGA